MLDQTDQEEHILEEISCTTSSRKSETQKEKSSLNSDIIHNLIIAGSVSLTVQMDHKATSVEQLLRSWIKTFISSRWYCFTSKTNKQTKKLLHKGILYSLRNKTKSNFIFLLLNLLLKNDQRRRTLEAVPSPRRLKTSREIIWLRLPASQ